MKKILVTLLTLLSIYVSAQVPGYQGKRFYVKYNCGISHPGMFGRNGKLPAVTHHGSIDYVITRTWALSLGYNFMTYKTPGNERLLDGIANPNIKSNMGRYTQHVVSISGKHFFKRRGFIAPTGPYINMGLYYQYTDIRYNEGQSSDVNYYYSIKSIAYKKSTLHYGGIVFGMGRNFIVANRILFDLGFVFHATLPPPNQLSGGTTETILYRDVAFRNLFQLHVGIGLLAF